MNKTIILKNTLASKNTLVEDATQTTSPELAPAAPAVSAETPIPPGSTGNAAGLVHTGENTGRIPNSTPVTIAGKQIVATQHCQHCNKDTIQKCIEVDTEDEAGITVWQCKECNQLTEFA